MVLILAGYRLMPDGSWLYVGDLGDTGAVVFSSYSDGVWTFSSDLVLAYFGWANLAGPPQTVEQGFAIAQTPEADRLYASGGLSTSGQVVDYFGYLDTDTHEWVNLDPLPAARYGHAMTYYDGTIYVHGGMDADNNVVGDLWTWSATNGWQTPTVAGIPVTLIARAYHSLDMLSTVWGPALVTVGGIDAYGQPPTGDGGYEEIYLYFLDYDYYEEAYALYELAPRQRHATVVCGDNILWLHGGIDAAGNMLNDLWQITYAEEQPGWGYKPIAKKIFLTDPPAGLQSHRLACYGDNAVFAAGGWRDADSTIENQAMIVMEPGWPTAGPVVIRVTAPAAWSETAVVQSAGAPRVKVSAPDAIHAYIPTIEVGQVSVSAPRPWSYTDQAASGLVEVSAPVATVRIGANVERGLVRVTVPRPRQFWDIAAANQPGILIFFTLTLTGAADELDDVLLPMVNFQSRLRDGQPSYLAATIPLPHVYEPAITARPTGELVIRKGIRLRNGEENSAEIARAALDSFRWDRGPRSASGTLVGYKTESNTAAAVRNLSVLTYQGMQADGKRLWRSEVDLFLRPGDLATHGADAMQVGMISYLVSATSADMQLTEA